MNKINLMIKEKGFSKIINVFKDFAWNIAATIISTIGLQLIIYPLLARWINPDAYGQLLTMMGIANIVVSSVGGGLNNARLIQQEKYSEKREGDFNLFLLISNILGTIIFGLIVFIEFDLTLLNSIMIMIYVFLGIIRGYWSVAYRLKIDYVTNFKLNLIIFIGYIVGAFMVKASQIWTLGFIVAELFGVLYLYFTSDLHRERYVRTDLCKETLKIFLVLVINTLIVNVVTYLDRLVLYPILGGVQVSIFTVSSFVGKSIGLVITPIASVLLSYYSQKTFEMNLKRYWMINTIIMAISFLAGGLAILLSPALTNILYPTILEDTLPYIYIANFASLVGVLSHIISPAVLKYADIKWQLVIQIVYIILYFIVSKWLLEWNGLYGFCLATLIVNSIRVLILLVVGHMGVKSREKSCAF